MSGPARSFSRLVPLLAFVAVGVFLLFVGGAAQVVIVAALLAYILDPLTTMIESRGIHRAIATLIVVGVLIGLCVAFGMWSVPMVVENVRSLQSGAGSASASAALEGVEKMLNDRVVSLGGEPIDLSKRVAEWKQQAGEHFLAFLVNDAPALLMHVITIPFMMFFLLKDGRQMKKVFVSLVPNRYFEFSMDLLLKMDVQLGNFLRSQFLDATVFGILSVMMLLALDVPYAVFIGLFAGLANLIPYVGPIAGAVPAFVFAVFDTGDVMRGVYVLIAYIVLKLIDDVLVQPFLMSRGVEIHPLFVLIAIMIGGGLFGILGMLLAVPVAGFLKVVLRESIITYRKYRFD